MGQGEHDEDRDHGERRADACEDSAHHRAALAATDL
jgi:hypothetical protein